MSASDKKRLRKEQSAGALTEKQLAARKEEKTLKLYTAGFLALIILVVGIAGWTLASRYIESTGVKDRKTIAVTANDVDINSAEFNYYYLDTINRFYNNLQSYYGDYAALYAQMFYGLQLDRPLSTQMNADGITWADDFINQAKEALASNYALCNAAQAEGFTLSEEGQAELEYQMSIVGLYAKQYGGDVTDYLKAIYGSGATEESYRDYMTMSTLAGEYYDAHKDTLRYTKEDYRAAEEGRYAEFSSFSGNYYYISTSDYLEGGTTDEEGKTTYSGKEKADAAAKAEADAKLLSEGTYASPEELDAAIQNLAVNSEKDASSTAFDDVLYGSLNSLYRDWVSEEGRKYGDITYFPVEAEDADGNTTVSSYYVVYYRGSNDNTAPLSNVRHLLVAFEGGTKDEDGKTVYSDEEKATAKAKAEEYLAEFLAGDKTEDSFSVLACEHTDDPGSKANGGLYEDVAPDNTYVQAFQDWAVDPARVVGDTGIVETNYGYHVMYYVGHSDISYRDLMINNELVEKAQSDWYEAIIATVTVTDRNLSRINRDLIIKSSANG